MRHGRKVRSPLSKDVRPLLLLLPLLLRVGASTTAFPVPRRPMSVTVTDGRRTAPRSRARGETQAQVSGPLGQLRRRLQSATRCGATIAEPATATAAAAAAAAKPGCCRHDTPSPRAPVAAERSGARVDGWAAAVQ